METQNQMRSSAVLSQEELANLGKQRTALVSIH
jgi:hypothetical protein